jgi:alpha-1,2-mannosyltransferase
MSTKRTTLLPLTRARETTGWLALFVSGAALCAFLWNHRQFDLHIYLDAIRGWPRHSLYDYRDPRLGLPFNYPPFAAVLLLPLRALDRAVVARLWLLAVIATSAWFIVTATKMAPRFPSPSRAAPVVAAVGIWSVPVLLTARLGQINWLLALAVLFDVKWERAGSRVAGLGTGFAAAIKLYPAAAVLYFVARRNWSAVRNVVAAAAGLSLLGALVMPHESVDYWTKQIFTIDRIFGAGNPLSTSMRREIAWLPLPDGVATLLWLVAAAGLGWVAFRRIRSAVEGGNDLAALTIAMCAGSACFPLTWSHHLYFLLPAVLLWFGDGRSRPRRLGAAALCVVLFEGLQPGRNAPLIVARAIALVVVSVTLPVDAVRQARPGVRSAGFP